MRQLRAGNLKQESAMPALGQPGRRRSCADHLRDGLTFSYSAALQGHVNRNNIGLALSAIMGSARGMISALHQNAGGKHKGRDPRLGSASV